jgi:archaemetzincin
MKYKIIPLFFIFIGVTLTTIILSASNIHHIKSIINQQEKIIYISPLGDVKQKYLDSVRNYIQNFYGFKCIIDNKKPLTKDILASSGKRYEANKIIKKYNSDKNILLLTDVDIAYFNKVKNIKEYGIIGLGFRPGKTCVVSTFRIKNNTNEKKFLDRLKKVSLHEVGHNLGLDHCSYDPKCLMNDAKGTVNQIDKELVWLCEKCKKIINF